MATPKTLYPSRALNVLWGRNSALQPRKLLSGAPLGKGTGSLVLLERLRDAIFPEAACLLS